MRGLFFCCPDCGGNSGRNMVYWMKIEIKKERMDMKQRGSRLIALLLSMVLLLCGCTVSMEQMEDIDAGSSATAGSAEVVTTNETAEASPEADVPDEDGTYTSKEDVAAYLNAYGHLPENFITQKDAKALGWDSSQGNLSEVAPGKSIGGDYFGNYEGRLPEADGREYHECDINSTGGYRGAERIVFSNDGLIYYTGDHYETFELLYGEP